MKKNVCIFLPFQVSCSPKGHVWAVDHKDKIWYRKGACLETPQGTTWKSISGSLRQVSAMTKLLYHVPKVMFNTLSKYFTGVCWKLWCLGNQFRTVCVLSTQQLWGS